MGKDIGNTGEKARLNTICRILQNQVLNDAECSALPCKPVQLRTLYTILCELIGPLHTVKTIGGLQSPFDICVNEKHQIEVKVGKSKSTSRAILERQPWTDGVQVLQSQITSENGKLIFGDDMMRAWFTHHVTPFIARTKELSDLKVEYGDYIKVVFTLNSTVGEGTGARNLIIRLRENKSLQKALQKEYLKFESDWLAQHPILLQNLETILKEKFLQKHIWICINKSGCYALPQILLEKLSSPKVVQKKKGGAVLHIEALFRKTQMNENYTVMLELRLNWKNGGQAVQNLNFDIRSAPKNCQPSSASSASSSVSLVQPQEKKPSRALKKFQVSDATE